MAEKPTTDGTSTNRVTLRGRVTRTPVVRALPSGTEICTVRISVRRQRTVMTKGSAQKADWLDCTAWTARMRARVGRWDVGDEVEIVGAIRRRHVVSAGGAGSMVDIEVFEGRRLRAGATVDATQSAGADSC